MARAIAALHGSYARSATLRLAASLRSQANAILHKVATLDLQSGKRFFSTQLEAKASEFDLPESGAIGAWSQTEEQEREAPRRRARRRNKDSKAGRDKTIDGCA